MPKQQQTKRSLVRQRDLAAFRVDSNPHLERGQRRLPEWLFGAVERVSDEGRVTGVRVGRAVAEPKLDIQTVPKARLMKTSEDVARIITEACEHDMPHDLGSVRELVRPWLDDAADFVKVWPNSLGHDLGLHHVAHDEYRTVIVVQLGGGRRRVLELPALDHHPTADEVVEFIRRAFTEGARKED